MIDVKPVQHLCESCGRQHATRAPSDHASHYHGKCDACGIKTSVTSARHYGVWNVPLRAEQ